MSVNRKNGEAIVGTLLHRDDHGVRVRTGDTEVEIPTADIKSVESALSAMPEVAALVLTKAEIRDLVESVSALKEPQKLRAEMPLRALRHLDAN